MSEPIAIVRLACRFPGADSASPFWQLIKDGVAGNDSEEGARTR